MKKPFTLIAAALLLAAFQQNPVHADGGSSGFIGMARQIASTAVIFMAQAP